MFSIHFTNGDRHSLAYGQHQWHDHDLQWRQHDPDSQRRRDLFVEYGSDHGGYHGIAHHQYKLYRDGDLEWLLVKYLAVSDGHSFAHGQHQRHDHDLQWWQHDPDGQRRRNLFVEYGSDHGGDHGITG